MASNFQQPVQPVLNGDHSKAWRFEVSILTAYQGKASELFATCALNCPSSFCLAAV